MHSPLKFVKYKTFYQEIKFYVQTRQEINNL